MLVTDSEDEEYDEYVLGNDPEFEEYMKSKIIILSKSLITQRNQSIYQSSL